MNKNPPRRARALTAGLVALLLAALYLYNKAFTDPKPKKKKR